MTFGGQIMENVNLGDVLLLPAPRISYPPMDIVLGIDFILSNFVEKKVYNELRCDPQYKSAVKMLKQDYGNHIYSLLPTFGVNINVENII